MLVLHAVAVFLAVVLIVRVWSRRRRGKHAKELAVLDSSWDAGEPSSDTGVVTRLAFEASCAVKDKFGELRYNSANRIVVGEFVRAYLRDKYPDLRVVDRCKHAAYAVELAFLPSPYASAAQRFADDADVGERRGSYRAVR